MAITPAWTGGDDTASVQAALNDGRSIDGEGRVYNVTGVIGNPSQIIHELTLKDIGGNRANQRTLYFPNGTDIDINVTIDRNGDGAWGNLNTDAGLWVDTPNAGSFFDARIRAKIKGAGIGSGATFNRPERCDIEVSVKDITWSAATMPSDDRTQGVWLRNGAKNSRIKPIVANCGGYVNGVFTKRFARNIVLSKTEQVIVDSPISIGGDQGIDWTGGDYNHMCQVIGGVFVDQYTYGAKVANCGYGVDFIGTKIIRPGSHGLIVSGPSGAVVIPTAYVRAKGVHVLSPGYGGNWNAHLPAAFMVMQGSQQLAYPHESEFVDCLAQDNQATKTMYDGFRTQTNGRKDSACRSIGHINAAFAGAWTGI